MTSAVGGGPMARRFLPVVLLVLAPLLAGPGAVAAQEEVSLERVQELTRLGRTEEAREALLAWWEGERPQASRRDRQRGLWLRGRLTVDPAQAELDFRRLAIEYPGGPFSSRALLRLAQAAWARGDADRAERHLAQLARDYPGTQVARDAQAWRSEAGTAPAAPVAAVGQGSPASEARSPAPDTVAPRPPASGSFAVQLGAFAGEGRARALRERMAGAGYESRLVRVEGSRLLHVRIGRYTERDDAEALLGEIRALGLTAALVQDAHQERRISR